MSDTKVTNSGAEATETGTGDQTNTNTQTSQETTIELPKTIEELQTMLQSEADKRVSQALATQKTKLTADLEAKIEAEKAEAARLAKLTAAEREKELVEKSKKDLEEREARIAAQQLDIDTTNLLTQKKLPIEFKQFVLGQDLDSTTKRIEDFSNLWDTKLEEALTEKLKGKTPETGTQPSSTQTGGLRDVISEGRLR